MPMRHGSMNVVTGAALIGAAVFAATDASAQMRSTTGMSGGFARGSMAPHGTFNNQFGARDHGNRFTGDRDDRVGSRDRDDRFRDRDDRFAFRNRDDRFRDRDDRVRFRDRDDRFRDRDDRIRFRDRDDRY